MIEIVDTAAKLKSLAETWRDIERCAANRVFQTYDWVWNGWHYHLGKNNRNRLYVLKWSHERSATCVIAPFFIDERGRLRFIMDDYSDTCDVVYGEGANLRLAFSEISAHLYDSPSVKSVWLQKMPRTSEALGFLGVCLNGAMVGRDNAYSWLPVVPATDFISSQQQMRSKDRSDLRCLRRQCDRYSLHVLSASKEDHFPEKELRALCEAMRASGRRSSDYFSDEDVEFLRSIYEDGICDIAILSKDGEAQALNAFLKKGDRITSWVFLYSDPRSSTALYLKFFCENRKPSPFVFDFGVGVYSYKIGTFRPFTDVTFSLLHSTSLLRCMINVLKLDLRMVKDVIKGWR